MYSNCLFEALKAKLKDWKNTKIIYLNPKINDKHWHFFWIKNSKVYHYSDSYPNAKHCRLFFRGVYKEEDLDTFEAFILHRYGNRWNVNKEKLGRRLGLPSIEKEGYLNWARYWPEEGLLDFPEKNKICKYVLTNDKINIVKAVKIEDLKKDQITFMNWKYLSPYDDCWKILSRDQM